MPDSPALACPLAAALLLWQREFLQPAAQRHLGSPVASISHYGSYACRRLYGRDSGPWSEHATANALDIAFCDALTLRFRRLRESSSRAVVLTGQGKMFSAGVDLPQMVEAGVPYIREFLPALHRLYDTVFNFPKPVVAAINGHAIAGGCILACCADHRLMAQDGGRNDVRMGVTEILVGVPFPPLAFEVMRSVTAPQFLAESILTGATVAFED